MDITERWDACHRHCALRGCWCPRAVGWRRCGRGTLTSHRGWQGLRRARQSQPQPLPQQASSSSCPPQSQPQPLPQQASSSSCLSQSQITECKHFPYIPAMPRNLAETLRRLSETYGASGISWRFTEPPEPIGISAEIHGVPGAPRSLPEPRGASPEYAGVRRSTPEYAGVPRSTPEYAGVRRSTPESRGVSRNSRKLRSLTEFPESPEPPGVYRILPERTRST